MHNRAFAIVHMHTLWLTSALVGLFVVGLIATGSNIMVRDNEDDAARGLRDGVGAELFLLMAPWDRGLRLTATMIRHSSKKPALTGPPCKYQ